MKFERLVFLSLFYIVSSVYSKSELKSTKSEVEASKRKKTHKEVVKVDLPPEESNSTLNRTNNTGPVILNSVGRKVYVKNSSDIILTQFPFSVSRCDQVVSFAGQFIPDMKEYRGRTDGWFTLSAHYANLFKDNNSSFLLRSILLSDTTIAPRIVSGTGGCVVIFSPDGPEHNIPICLNKTEDSQNILEVIKTFAECRGGIAVNSDKIDKLKVAEMIKSCGGKGKFVNPLKLLLKLNKRKQQSLLGYKNAKWFHPGFDGVPGTQGVGAKQEVIDMSYSK